MPDANGSCTIRECANEILRAMEKHGDSQDKLRASLLQAANKLMDRPDFTSLGVKYKPNHVPEGTYLFYDGELSITFTRLPEGKNVPPHDHGIWEAVIIHSGKLRHIVYERTDDQTREGYAKLAVTDVVTIGKPCRQGRQKRQTNTICARLIHPLAYRLSMVQCRR